VSRYLEHNTEHRQGAEDLVIEQFKRSEKFNLWLRAYIDRVQNLEDTYRELYTLRTVDTAVGVQLDALGSLVGEARKGLGDEDYRTRIKVRVRLNTASGLERDIVDVFSLILNDATPPIDVMEAYPAGLVVRLNEYLPAVSPTVLADILRSARATGVDTSFWYQLSEDGIFECSSDAAPETGSADEGFAQASAGVSWDTASPSVANSWSDVAYSPALDRLVAVANSGTSARVMYSDDGGDTWQSATPPAANAWNAVCWSAELSLFVAVANSGTNRVMSSSDGISWTTHSAASASDWYSICWSAELSLFVAVAFSGHVMTSANGTAWTSQTPAESNNWFSVCWSPELSLFVAVGASGTNRVMTSPDGAAWSPFPAAEANQWSCVVWSPLRALFVATAVDGTNQVMTSPDGENWTAYASTQTAQWWSVCWSPSAERFYAFAHTGTGHRVMSSAEGSVWDEETAVGAGSAWAGATDVGVRNRVVGVGSSNSVILADIVPAGLSGGKLAGVIAA
jgi:hypothetical protein